MIPNSPLSSLLKLYWTAVFSFLRIGYNNIIWYSLSLVMTSVFPSAVSHCLWFPNTGCQPHVSRFTLCSSNLDSLCSFMFLCCASTPDVSQLLTCSVAVLCGTNVGHYTVILFEKFLHIKFLSWVRFLKYCKNSHISNAPFSGKWNSWVKRFSTLVVHFQTNISLFLCLKGFTTFIHFPMAQLYYSWWLQTTS